MDKLTVLSSEGGKESERKSQSGGRGGGTRQLSIIMREKKGYRQLVGKLSAKSREKGGAGSTRSV